MRVRIYPRPLQRKPPLKNPAEEPGAGAGKARGILGSVIFWDTVYSAIFPAWFHWLLPLIYGSLFGILALGFWRLSLLAARRRVAWFCLLGGLVSLVGHTIGISRGLMRVPLLAGASPTSALVFGAFEFIFYFCAITGISAASRWLSLRMRPKPRLPGAY